MTALVINSLSMKFGGLVALNNINMTVSKNSITALIGPNGAGKTTLFNCLTGFYQPSNGQLHYYRNDQLIDIRILLGPSFQFKQLFSPKLLSSFVYYNLFGGSHLVAQHGIIRTFQHARLFRDMTVVENMLIGQHVYANRNILSGLFKTDGFKASERTLVDTAYRWLDKFNLAKDANRLAGELPYGKQRLLEIARAMSAQPHILCLDEPAAGLNPFESKELSDIIISLKREFDLTIVLIEHDMSVVMNISDHIYVLVKGEIIAQGSPQIVKSNPKVIEAYLGTEVTHQDKQ